MADWGNKDTLEMADQGNKKTPDMADHDSKTPPKTADMGENRSPEMADHSNHKSPEMAEEGTKNPPEIADHGNKHASEMADHGNKHASEMADHGNKHASEMAGQGSQRIREMSDQRNNSSRMKDLLQPDFQSPTCHQEKAKQAGCSFSTSTSAPPSVAVVSRAPAEREVSSWAQEGDGASCCLLDDLKRLPQCSKQLGPLNFSRTHTVLIDLHFFNYEATLKPQEGKDTWSSNFVKMPCSQGSYMTVKTGMSKQVTQVWRWDVISKHLGSLSKKAAVTADDVERAIMKYNPKYKSQWSFDGLSAFLKSVPKAENYFSSLLPKVAALALKLPDHVKKAIPLLQRGRPAAITLSQVQISCLLANAFFCTFPHRNTTLPKAEYYSFPSINFTSLFGNWSGRKREKLRAIMHYFKVVTDDNAKLDGLLTFERCCLRASDAPDWRSCKETLPKLHVTSLGTIEGEGTGMLQVDFASSWIGGGVLGSGLVQEEILFLLNPELIVSRLFTEKLEDNECLVVTGCQQFSRHSGFGDTFEWAGPYEDCVQMDEWARRQRHIVAIDALNFKHRMEQYNMRHVTRELKKAYCGFKSRGNNEPDIATGKWGCGAFNGDPQLKAVIQLMAAAKADRGLAFFTFQDEELSRGLQQIYHLLLLEGATVEKLYRLLEDFCAVQGRSRALHGSLFEFISSTIRHSRSQL
ncbi:poly(ADP-ribose) glycohydrolase isoform X2 [Antennarius striatus]|uniref:poly(ADP-ribose) glycohydrolase isoform X2 n=1 Tax=Antennarius striatus TaxID=241820 RepID=UPI0035B11D83